MKTIITFENLGGRVVEVGRSIPNIGLGQRFAFDHPDMARCGSGHIVNIQHAVNVDGQVTTYLDVGQ